MSSNGVSIYNYLKTEQPWVNTEKYSWLQVILFLTGALLWLICYGDTLYDIKKKKTVNIPIVAVCLNFGWELATCLFFVPDMGKLIVLSYWAWMGFDVFIFISAFLYGHKQMQTKFFIENSHFFILTGFIISVLSQSAFITQYDLPMAPLSAYLINLPMSVGFIYLLFVPDFNSHSRVTAWCKFLGTGLISLMFYLEYAGNYFLNIMYLAVAFFDIIYIVLMYKRHILNR